MGKNRKPTKKDNANLQQCYVRLSKQIVEENVSPVQQVDEKNIVAIEEMENSVALDINCAQQIHDTVLEQNHLIKEILWNVQMLRKEVAEMREHVTECQSDGKCQHKRL